MNNFTRWLGKGTDSKSGQNWNDFGLLILRISLGLLMMLGHGSGKLAGFAERADSFADPFGLGSTASLSLAVFAEFFCSIALIFGLFTRLAVIPLIITMLVAIFYVHINDPWSKIEFPLLFLIPYITLFFTGAGRFSIDRKLFGGRY